MYNFYMPTQIFFGIGSLSKVIEISGKYKEPRILVVTDEGIINSGLFKSLTSILESINSNFLVFSEVEPNPKSVTVGKGVRIAKDFNTNLIVGFGGGSSIDTAKAIGIMLNNDGDILDYEGVNKVKNDSVDLIAIPTTAGTGSEVTASTVITDENSLFKAAIISPKVFPKYAIVDPELTITCPKGITSSTAVDALTHAIESYLSKQENGLVSEMALKAIRLINDNIETVYMDGSNIEKRQNVLEAAMLAGLCFSQTRLGNVHAISQAFGGVFNIPHGFANAVLLPYVLEFNLPVALDKYCDIAKALNVFDANLSKEENAQKVIDRIKQLNANLDIPKTTKDLGVELNSIDRLVQDSMRSGNVLVNPRETNADDIKSIIEYSYYGYKVEEKV